MVNLDAAIRGVQRAFHGNLKIKEKKLVDVMKLLELADYFDTPLPFYEALKDTTGEAYQSDSESEEEEEVEY